MLTIEDTYMELARTDAMKGQDVIVIGDRGAMDPSAYMSRESWLEVLELEGLHEVSLRDTRYDAVIHLVTAAMGAEEYFGSENNKSRSEDIPLARELDRLVAQAWVGHPYYNIIDNEGINFEEKKNRVIQCVLRRLGLEDTRYGAEIQKRKFLCTGKSFEGIDCREFEVVHHYLISNNKDVQTRIRKRGSFNSFLYTLTQRHYKASGHIEVRRSISSREYSILIEQADPNRTAIEKKRYCFLWNNHYFQLDEYCNSGLLLLEAYLKDDYQLPEFINIDREVTMDPSYSMYQLSKIQ